MRVSARARRLRLIMTADGLEVVVPRGFDQRRIPHLVEGKRDWIDRAAGRAEAQRRRLETDPPRLPVRITLTAVGEDWVVEYRADPRSSARGRVRGRSGGGAGARKGVATVRERSGQHLLVTGEASDPEACRKALRRWLSRRARRELVPRLAGLARRHGLAYACVSIRQPRTRWGSCSRRGTISLNARLLFLPPAAVDYVLLHELCHTVEMNHSPRFWTLLSSVDPDYRAHKKLVRTAAAAMPSWVDHELREAEV